MANQILAAPQRAHQSVYQLPEAARLALQVSPTRMIPADKLAQIEQQRIKFAELNGGCPFGQADVHATSPKSEK